MNIVKIFFAAAFLDVTKTVIDWRAPSPLGRRT